MDKKNYIYPSRDDPRNRWCIIIAWPIILVEGIVLLPLMSSTDGPGMWIYPPGILISVFFVLMMIGYRGTFYGTSYWRAAAVALFMINGLILLPVAIVGTIVAVLER